MDDFEGFSGSGTVSAASVTEFEPAVSEVPVSLTRTDANSLQQALTRKRADSISFLNSVGPGKRRGRFTLPRETFDPTNRAHIKSYKSFLETGNWGSVQFHVEYPYETVSDTVTRRFALHALHVMELSLTQ